MGGEIALDRVFTQQLSNQHQNGTKQSPIREKMLSAIVLGSNEPPVFRKVSGEEEEED